MSYTNNANLKWDSTSDANFRASGIAFIHNAFTGSGSNWAQTADTGQLDPTTVTAPAQNTFATGYLIYAMNDSLASAFAPTIKFEFGANNNATKGFGIKITFGTGSDLAGTITGATVVFVAANNTATATGSMVGGAATAGTGASAFDSYASLDSGRAGFLLWRNHSSSAAAGTGIYIERALDSAGNYVSAYYTVLTLGGNSVGSQMWHVFKSGTGTSAQVGSSTNNAAQYPIVHNSAATSLALGSNAPLSPVFPLVGRIDNPMTVVGAVKTGDQTEGQQFSATVYGISHTYIFTKTASSPNLWDSGVNWGTAMRFD